MNGDIEHRLATAAEAFGGYEMVNQRCAELQDRADLLTVRVVELRKRYAGERQDVERLEGRSLTRVLATLRGARDDALARERAEAEAVHYRLMEFEARLDAVQREYRLAHARLTELATAPARYAAMLEEKERYLRDSADPRSWQLLSLAHEQGRLTSELRQVVEAVSVAGSAWDALSEVRNKLRSAESWSTSDVWGGGILTAAAKYSRIDDAAHAAAVADRCLVVLRTELADVSGEVLSSPEVAVDGLTRFTDVWMDGLAGDWTVRERIRDALRNVGVALDRVRELDDRLRQREARTRSRLARIGAERRELLTVDDPTVPRHRPRLEQFRT